MCRLMHSLLLLLSFFRTSQCSTSTRTLTVRPGENATLPCVVPASPYMAWYQQIDDQIKLIISVSRKKEKMDVYVDYITNEAHFLPITESSNDSVSLLIVTVDQSDTGLYYCGGQPNGRYTIFGQAIHLTLPGVAGRETGTGLCWKLLIAAVCVLALALVLCVSMVFCRPGLSPTFCLNCVKENSSLKAADLQYASLRHTMISQGRRPAPASDNVTYDAVAKKTTTNPRV